MSCDDYDNEMTGSQRDRRDLSPVPNTTLSDWPTSAALEDFLRELRSLADGPAPTPSDELAAKPPVCEPNAKPRTPQRLGDDVVVDEEGELVKQGELS